MVCTRRPKVLRHLRQFPMSIQLQDFERCRHLLTCQEFGEKRLRAVSYRLKSSMPFISRASTWPELLRCIVGSDHRLGYVPRDWKVCETLPSEMRIERHNDIMYVIYTFCLEVARSVYIHTHIDDIHRFILSSSLLLFK